MPQRLLITGASTGIGEQLALAFARRGHSLALLARRVEALADLKARIAVASPGATVEIAALDVTDLDAVAPAIEAMAAKLGGLDVVVANAGIGDGGGKIGTGGFARDAKVIQTNVLGAMATLDAGIAHFRQQGHGQAVAIASVAAARGLPGAGSYSASKAAIAVYADSARAELHGTKITITTLFPGYIDTAINRRMKSRPFVIPVEEGGEQIARLIERRVQTAAVPWFPWAMAMRAMAAMPTAAIARQDPFAE